jgi:hypothetical protein
MMYIDEMVWVCVAKVGWKGGLWKVGVKLDQTFKSIEGGEGNATRKETEPDANADEFDPTLGLCIRLCLLFSLFDLVACTLHFGFCSTRMLVFGFPVISI